jgi:aryl-alcohol dehydrogenase-like predicted oxidoreductase
MRKRFLGRSGLEVSAVGLGCMGLSHAYGAPTEKSEAIKFIREAAEMGCTFFDTAEIYGTQDNPHDNESLVGEALKSCRDKVVIATKFGIKFDTSSDRVPYPIVADASPDRIRKSLEGSLKRLQADCIDLYYQHRMDPNVPAEEVAGIMADLMKEGKIRHWGVSEADEEYIRRAHAVCPITAVENRYSMMARHHESLFPVLEELGIGFVAFSPMANGILTGKYGKGTNFDKRYDYRAAMPQFTDEGIDKNKELLAMLRRIAQEKGATEAQVSLAWMMCKKPWIVPIAGTRKIDRLIENAGAAEVRLSEEEIVKLDKALDDMEMSDVFGAAKHLYK